MIVYRNAGPWGDGKGSDLVAPEIDNNFYELANRILAVENDDTQPNSIKTITVDDAGRMFIELDDGEVQGPFPLPVIMPQPKGDWQAGIAYHVFDEVFADTYGLYSVLQSHTSDATFDPARLIGGTPVYQLIMPTGASGTPGAPGAPGPTGPTGPQGEPFEINTQGAFATRSAFDAEALGFTFLSTNGAAGGGGPDVLYIMGPGGSADWLGPFAWEGPAGAAGATGPAGATGAPGANFNADAVGIYADRAAHNSAPAGFSYLSTNGDAGITTNDAVIFFRETATAGVWSAPVKFQGPKGNTGATGLTGPAGLTGPQGPAGLNYDVDATGVFAGRSAYDAQPQGFSYLSTNGDGGANLAASIYIKNSNTNADWSSRIPFAGPRGLTGPTGPAGAAGAAGTPGVSGANGVGVPTGGTTGQILAKTSNTNFATGWTNPGGAVYPIETLIFALSDETTAITTGVSKLTARMPYKGQIVGLPRASLSVAAATGTPTVDINKTGASILSTKLTIDATERTSTAAAVPAVVSDDQFNDDVEFTFDVDAAGAGAKGLKVMLRIQQVT